MPNPESRIPNPQSPIPNPEFQACPPRQTAVCLGDDIPLAPSRGAREVLSSASSNTDAPILQRASSGVSTGMRDLSGNCAAFLGDAPSASHASARRGGSKSNWDEGRAALPCWLALTLLRPHNACQ